MWKVGMDAVVIGWARGVGIANGNIAAHCCIAGNGLHFVGHGGPHNCWSCGRRRVLRKWVA